MDDYDGVHSLALGIGLGHHRGEMRGRATPWKEGETTLRERCGLNAVAVRDGNGDLNFVSIVQSALW